MCLYLTKRNSTYYFRRVIPTELRPILGAREFTFSLGTKDKEEAKPLRSAHAVRTDRLIEEAWAVYGSPTPSTAPPAASKEVSEDQLALEELELQEVIAKEGRREELADYIAFLEDRLKGSTRQMPRELRAFRYILEGRQFDNDLLSDQLLVARVEKRELEKKLQEASASSPLAILEAIETKAGAMLDTTIVDLWSAEKKPQQKGIDGHRAVARWLYERIGSKPVDQLARTDFLAFKAKLVGEGQSPANIKQKLSRLRTLMQWAFDNGYAASNPATGVTIKDTQAAKNKRLPFDLASLSAIFSSPVFTQGDRPVGLRGEAGYWLPLLALFTGARLEELGQLRPKDVAKRNYVDSDGVERSAWFIYLREDAKDGLKLKTAESARHIPVHRELVRLGFLAFASAANEAKQQWLFALLRADKYGRRTAKWGENWSVYRRNVCRVTERRMVFHSFRHTFKDYTRLAGIDEGIQRQLMGHSARDVADDYGSGHWDHQLVEAMNRYKVPGLNLPAPAPKEAR